MRVGPGRGHGAAAAHQTTAAPAPQPEPEPEQPTATTDVPTAAPADDRTSRSRKAGGVVDKLASGHFNDVAAMRLRLNHADAIREAGVELPDAPTESTHPGRGFTKALEAYRAAMPAPEPVPDATELGDDAVAEEAVVDLAPDAPVIDEPTIDQPAPEAPVIDPATVVDDEPTLVEQLLDGAAVAETDAETVTS